MKMRPEVFTSFLVKVTSPKLCRPTTEVEVCTTIWLHMYQTSLKSRTTKQKQDKCLILLDNKSTWHRVFMCQ